MRMLKKMGPYGLVWCAFALAAASCAPSFNYDLIGAQESYGEQQEQADSLKVCVSAKSWGKNKTFKNNVRNLKAAILEIRIENKSSNPVLIDYKGIALVSTKDTLKKIEAEDMYEKMRYRKGDAIVAGILTSPIYIEPRYFSEQNASNKRLKYDLIENNFEAESVEANQAKSGLLYFEKFSSGNWTLNIPVQSGQAKSTVSMRLNKDLVAYVLKQLPMSDEESSAAISNARLH